MEPSDFYVFISWYTYKFFYKYQEVIQAEILRLVADFGSTKILVLRLPDTLFYALFIFPSFVLHVLRKSYISKVHVPRNSGAPLFILHSVYYDSPNFSSIFFQSYLIFPSDFNLYIIGLKKKKINRFCLFHFIIV